MSEKVSAAAEDEALLGLLYKVRRLIARQRYAEMQQLIEKEAKRRQLTPWDLSLKLGELGRERGIARPQQIVVLPEASE